MEYSAFNTFNPFKRMSENEKQKRFTSSTELIEVNPYLTYFMHLTEFYEDVMKYPNVFIEQLLVEFKYCEGKFDEKVELKRKYDELYSDLSRACHKLASEAAANQERMIQ